MDLDWSNARRLDLRIPPQRLETTQLIAIEYGLTSQKMTGLFSRSTN